MPPIKIHDQHSNTREITTGPEEGLPSGAISGTGLSVWWHMVSGRFLSAKQLGAGWSNEANKTRKTRNEKPRTHSSASLSSGEQPAEAKKPKAESASRKREAEGPPQFPEEEMVAGLPTIHDCMLVASTQNCNMELWQLGNKYQEVLYWLKSEYRDILAVQETGWKVDMECKTAQDNRQDPQWFVINSGSGSTEGGVLFFISTKLVKRQKQIRGSAKQRPYSSKEWESGSLSVAG